ncbi:integrator complex subunit 4 [Neophocaena asiaeorientalis asiaeorientalis]|uniref:Integrator complex subunit 4 n=3 Tax=Odontoceti TaxID=9722 RepID=A0A2U4CFL6_TURTR|nr:integrator complex subunit 4 isoform X1 [Tursiops truncatus]XP_024605176.1 integrator complex subunit 4 [Neophocaena asiaeorientalis asiaeorientalis]XP_033718085.1 integrator complex subunit 4 isoform X1 [Tursiops truncatus]
MAAHLKKRVYEEFTKVVQQQQEEIATKKLRLTKPSKSAALHIDLCKATSPADALQYLLQFARKPVEAESVEGVVRILLEHYYKENDPSVRLKIASLLGLLSKTAGFSPDCIMDDAINILQNEKSHQVLAQLLDTLLAIGTKLPDNQAIQMRLVDVACKHLTDTSHGVRNKCLQLLGNLGSLEKSVTKDAEGLAVRDVQKIIGDYFSDQDPRVRTAAIKAMLQLHERGLKLYQTIYTQACKLLSDDYEQVRSAAVQLIWVVSQLYPESIVPIPSSNEEIRLVDDAFGKICHMVSDSSWVVRVQASKLLGSMEQVSSHFLEQTLDKKLMSDLRRKRTAHERAKELYTSGEFSSGRKWGDDAPKEEVDTGAVNLIESGACGAFVHGLEDEMYEVRIAAVEALCMLAQSSPSFAEKCLDFLVDMFNDEIEEVRLQSIHTMRKISNNITLREDQLDTVLAVLEDSSRDIREALHELLCCTNVSTKEGIHLALVELLKNLTKYPTDRDSIWKCLKFLGSRHPTLVLPLVPELLSTHPFFDTAEPDMDDPAYIAVLVLIFNAAKTCPTMPALFSDHTFRHYAYLRDSLSHLVPALRLPGRKLVSSALSPNIMPHEDPSHQFLQQSLERVYSLQHLDPQGTQELLEFTIRDLQRLGELQSELAGVADFSATYLRCQLLLIKALQEKLWNVAAPLYLKQSDLASAAAKQIMEETYKMEFMYSGVENKQVVIIHHMRLQAKALQLIVTARTARGVDPLFGMCEKFLQEVDFFQRCFIADLPHLQDSFVDKLLDLMPRLMTSKPAEVVKILHTMLRQSTFLHLPLPEQIHKASATIIEPAGESDNPLRFTSGLVVALDVDATLEHVQDPQSTVKVQVSYPDGQAQMIHPKPADFRNPGPGRHRLITQVYLSHTAWTEPCQVEVRLLLAYNSSSRIPKSPWIEGGEMSSQVETSIEGTIPFSKSVKVYIMPKPARR